MSHRTPEERRAYTRKNREKINAKNRLAYARHREQRRLKKRQSYASHRAERILEKRLARASNPEKSRSASRLYRLANPGITTAATKRKRAIKKGSQVNNLTHAQWLEIQVVQNHRCCYCGKRCKGRLTQDHITPLSRGGSHTLHNVIAACRVCNSTKHVGTPPKPVQPLLLTIAPERKRRKKVS